MSGRDGEARLAAALEAAGGHAAGAREIHADLNTRYAEPQRAYHTMRHIEKCLAWLDWYRGLAEAAAEVDLALWFHDAVYDPRSADNERESAQLAHMSLERAGVPEPARARVADLILATAGHDVRRGDQALMVSIDLAILGAAPGDYDDFESAIRTEYAHVSEPAYVRGRSQVLAGFLARPVIYPCRPLGEVLEAQARRNLERALARLAEAGSVVTGTSQR